MIVLREDQEVVVNDLRTELKTSASVLVRAPCRFGKTVVSAFIAMNANKRGKRIIFACHRDSILNQTAKTLAKFNVKYGFIASGYAANPFALSHVASADTLRNRLDALKECSLLIVDECHLWNSRTRKLIIDAAKEAGCKIIGLSATPIRLDGKPLSDLFDTMVMGPTEAWLIEHGFLAKYRAFSLPNPGVSSLKTREGDYTPNSAAEAFDKPAVVGNLVETWRKHAQGLRTVVYAINRKHARNICDAYNAAGIPAGYIDGETPKAEQKRVINALADGKIHVLVSVELLTTGFDLSSIVGRDVSIQCVQLARPTKSLQLAIQMMMRCMTAQEGLAIILDHVGIIMNADGTVNHGFPDDEREWSLAGRDARAQDGAPSFAISNCANCFGAYKASLLRCPHCSSDRVVKPRLIEEREGELEEIRRAEQKRQETRKARDLESVVRVAVERGYKPGWVAQRLKHIGARPVSFSEIHAAMMQARQEVAA